MAKWVTTLQPPMVRTVRFAQKSSGSKKYRLSLPWVVYLTRFAKGPDQKDLMVTTICAAFCHEKPIDSSIVYHVPLPNVYGRWKLCINLFPHRDRSSVDACVQYWWSSLFSRVDVEPYSPLAWYGMIVMRDLFPGANFMLSLSHWSEMTVKQVMKIDISKLNKDKDKDINQKNFEFLVKTMTYKKFNSFIKDYED